MTLNILLARPLGAIFSACRAALSYPVSMAAVVAVSIGSNLKRDGNPGYNLCNGWVRNRLQRLGGRTRAPSIGL